jgi:hypothetical protein
MEKFSWTDRVRNEGVLIGVQALRNFLQRNKTKEGELNWSHIV